MIVLDANVFIAYLLAAEAASARIASFDDQLARAATARGLTTVRN